MARLPTAEENARRVLDIYVEHFNCRPGDVLRTNNFLAVADKRRLHYEDISTGIDYGIAQGWLETFPDDENMWRLTTRGFEQAGEETAMDDAKNMTLIQQAVHAVPAVKYAVGIGGVVWVIAAIGAMQVDIRLAVFGTIVMILLMTLLLVFAKLSDQAAKTVFMLPMLFLVWSAMILSVGSATLVATSVFFKVPLDLTEWIKDERGSPPGAEKKA